MVSWTVVEQERYVHLGMDHFRNGELQFTSSLRNALAAEIPDVVLLASVLQYLPDPYDLIRNVAASRVPRIVIDRTPCSALERDVLTVQKVPRQMYAASYPCWIFSRQKLMQAFAPCYATLSSYSEDCGAWHGRAGRVELAGYCLERRV
jgi:putative methyltransferase (TIGR04325 family)